MDDGLIQISYKEDEIHLKLLDIYNV